MRSTFKDRTGERFGRLTVVAYVDRPKAHARWLVRCDCGTEKIVFMTGLLNGNQLSCGCFQRETARARHTRHGHSDTYTYHSWQSMMYRCNSPKANNYHCWGGRGITVCERWRWYPNFLEDMGERPQGRSLDRIDNEQGYEPGNCRWATPVEQARNRRPARREWEAL